MRVLKPADDTSWFYSDESWTTPKKSVTHESLEYTLAMGRHKKTKTRIISRKQLNFQSYPMNDVRFSLLQAVKKKEYPLESTYQRDYVQLKNSICPYKNAHEADTPDWLFNRRCPNDFDMQQSSSSKFMDDHLVNLTDARKKKNFFRQLRNVSYDYAAFLG